MSIKTLWTRMVFPLTTERRSLLISAQENLKKLGLPEDAYRPQLEAVRYMSKNASLLRHVSAQASRHLPTTTRDVLAGCGDPSGKHAPAKLTDQHFIIYRETLALYGTKNWQDESRYRDHAETLRYALHNPDDWVLIKSILVDRDIWDHDEVMDTLRQLRESGSMALTDGAL